MNRKEVLKLQDILNRFTSNYLKGVAPLIKDGDKGHSTNKRIQDAKYWLGYRDYKGVDAPDIFLTRLKHPRDRRYLSLANRRLGIQRRAAQKARWAQQQVGATIAPGVTKYDGVPVAKWLVPYLTYARGHGWKGRLVSGWRSPAYSDSLCRRMCGRPSCPGKCAGRASNHAGSAKPRGALDVSDYYNFGRIVRNSGLSPVIFNGLGARDPVHFSQSGR